MKKLSPLEAVEEVLMSTIWYNGYSARGRDLSNISEEGWKRLKPGALVERMPEKIREALRRLRPHHFDVMRLDKWEFMDDEYERKKALSEELMEFDKKILK